MATCHRCGRPATPGTGFCTGCGTVLPAAGSRAGVVAAVFVTVAVLAVVAAFALFTKPAATAGAPVADPDFRPTVTVAAPPSSDQPARPLPEEQPPPSPDAADTALAELQVILDADRPIVETLVGQWVPQLSAKRPGMVVEDVTYDHVEILRDFRATQARYPDALLLFSGEYSSFKHGDFWITVEPLPHFDGQSANAWCDGEGIPVDDCYAKMISHTVGYEGATMLRTR